MSEDKYVIEFRDHAPGVGFVGPWRIQPLGNGEPVARSEALRIAEGIEEQRYAKARIRPFVPAYPGPFVALMLCLLAPALVACGGQDYLVDAGDVPFTDAPYDPETDAGVPLDTPGADVPPSPDDAPSVTRPDSPFTEVDLRTPEGFIRRRAEMYCAARAEGVCAFCAATPTCVDTMFERLRDDDDDSTFHPDEVEYFLLVLEEAYAGCEDLTQEEFAAHYPFHGEGELGEVCVTNADCDSRLCVAAVDGSTCRLIGSSEREPLCEGA